MRKLIAARSALAILWLTVLLPAALAQSSYYRIIVHPDNLLTSISKADASAYLLKKKRSWPDGGRVQPVDLAAQSPVRQALSEDIHGRSVASINNYWQRQIFSGRETPPPELGSDDEILSFVRANPGAIGYVSSSASLEGVKELAVN